MLRETKLFLKQSKNEHGEVLYGADVPFERTRRITGYLVGGLERFNNAKRAEERDRVKHGVNIKNRKGQDLCL